MRSFIGRWILLGIFSLSLAVDAATVKNLRISHTAAATRLVMILDEPVQQTWFINGDRLIVDLQNSKCVANFADLDLSDTVIKSVRTLSLKKNKLRFDIQLQKKVQPKIFAIRKSSGKDDRLVIDLYEPNNSASVTNPNAQKNSTLVKPDTKIPTIKNISDTKSSASSAPNIELAIKRNYLIAVDPGHGGEDSGALGPNNEQEKNVTLAISKELVEQINAQPGYNAKLLRTSDYYLSLQKRRDLAREYKADLLISIHADSFKDPDAYGASVFALSRKGATSEMARFLAQRENDSDLIGRVGGTTLDDKDAVLQGVLVDLSMNTTVNSSLELGKLVLNQLSKFAPLHSNHVEQAGFLVLKSPDVPSILVETGFISNKRETKKLASPDYQTQIAQAVLKGIQLYFEQHPPTTVTRTDSKADAKTDIKSEK